MNENNLTDEKYEHYRLVISKEQSPIRIDKYISSKIKYATRNRVQNAIKEQRVLVNDSPVKVHYFIKPDDIITIFFSTPPKEREEIEAQNIPLDIIYEDDNFLIVNKPAGMLTHPSLNVYQDTLLNALLYHFKNYDSPDLLENPGLVHRLDKWTSGLMIIAKTEISLKSLTEQFFNHTIKRKYLALVYGIIKDENGTINASIENNPSLNRVKISKLGKRAITHYKVLEKSKHLSLVECELETGRTHQIRVHFEYISHPLVGETVYNTTNQSLINEIKDRLFNDEINLSGQALHSYYMRFFHPVLKKELEFHTSTPEHFSKIMQLDV